jgi:hypothetical protein
MRTVFVSALLLLAACSSSKSNDGAQNDGGSATAAGDGAVPPGPTTFVMKQHVTASSEAFRCMYVQMPPTDGYIVGGQHQYTAGSHHLLLYRTDLTAMPAGGGNIIDCYEGSSDVMSHIRGVVYAAQTPQGDYTMPQGIGLPYKANDIFLFQTHYLNPNGADLDAEADVYLQTTSQGVSTPADLLFFYDPYIDVPAGGRATAGMRCPIQQDITMLSFGSHYHARGVGYSAFLDPPNGPRATTPFYTSASWSNPTITTATISVPAGSHIRYQCQYDNTQGAQPFFQGDSAATNEMCMFVALYYPAMSLADDECFGGDEVGQGTASCVDTMSCMQACAAKGQSGGAFDPTNCEQACLVASCPASAGPLVTAGNCIQQSCAAACAASDAGTSSACTSCVVAHCANEYEACATAPCQPAN